jgi:hypothetical protein
MGPVHMYFLILKRVIILLLISLVHLEITLAQSTFGHVKTIFDNNCTIGCHSGPSASGQLDLSGSASSVLLALLADPVNPAALEEGMRLVDPGYPDRSFLFAKVAADIDPFDHTIPAMGVDMPQNQPALAHKDIEMIRQWILFGADTVTNYVDPQIVEDYYGGNGLARVEPLVAPAPEDGFQIHYGPFFLAPLQEKEYFYKYATNLPEPLEVNRIQTLINEESHHTALYRYYPQADTNFLPGLRPVQNVLVAAGVYYTSDIIGQWPNSQDLILPDGAAFNFAADVVVDLNYHIPNYSADSILAAEFYMNIYTQPVGTAQHEMKSAPMYYGGADPTALTVPGFTVDSVYTFATFDTDSSYTWYIWSMMAHTHQLGQDYQVWKRNPDGTKGENVYNGHYNSSYTFDQGYYDWQHPPFRTFDDELLEVDMTHGLIHEATFSNPGSETVWFGLRTTDEMYVTYVQYVEAPLTPGISEQANALNSELIAYPNPTNGLVNLNFESKKAEMVSILLLDQYGKEVYRLDSKFGVGDQTLRIDIGGLGLAKGVYLVQITSDHVSRSARVALF